MGISCCKKCKGTNLYTEERGHNTGLYCSDCGAWIQWLGKDQLRAYNKSSLPNNNLTDTINKINWNPNTSDLRKCSGYYFKYNGKQYEKHEFEIGCFHQFGCKYDEFENGAGNYTTAIVELPNGQVVEADVSSIVFFEE